MRKVRVYQLAKELNVQSALILELLDLMGQDVKSDLSVLDATTAEFVRERVTLAIETETKRIVEEQKQQRIEEQTALRERDQADATVAAPAAPVEEPADDVDTPSGEERAPAGEPAEPAAVETVIPPVPSPADRPEPTAPPLAAKPAASVPSGRVAPDATTTVGRAPTPGAPVGRKPRVFPARRIPTAGSLLGRAKPAKPPVGPGAPPRTGVPGPGRPVPGFRQEPGRGPLPGRKRRKKDKGKSRDVGPAAPTRPRPDLPPVPEKITLSEGVTVKELAEKLNRKSKDVIVKLIPRGILVTINQPLDPEMAIAVADEFGSKATIISFEQEALLTPEVSPDDAIEQTGGAPTGPTEPRPPVVTVMGHVDHGKTSLLDAIRATNVVDREAGGITQHIGAYQVDKQGRRITFLDTPGHEAFTLMRARGAKATDIVVLVVAADDGVKPQTQEAIDHARAAGVPIVVAINKVDKANANPERVKQQLAERELLIEEYGGKIVSCEVSAKKNTGIEDLLEMILLQADLEEITAQRDAPATGVVLEARLDRARGVLATVLVQNGTLKIGDPFIAGAAYGKVRAMTDEGGRRVQSAEPSTPVEVMGFATQPGVGDSLQALGDEAKARQIASFRQEKLRAEQQRQSSRRTLESLSQDIAAGAIKDLPILLKGDVQGSLEALQKALDELPSDKVRLSVLRSSIGAINQADVLLAAASNAIVVGFNVRPDKAAERLAIEEKVELRMYSVIYDLINDMKQAMVGLLEPTFKENVLGQAQVRQVFRVPKIGAVAGCYVTEGKVLRSAEVRLLRDNVVVHTGKVGSLRRFKDDVAEVKQGYECGIGIANYNDVKESDVIEFFVMEKIAAKSL